MSLVNCPHLFFGTDPIKKVDRFKYLGIYVDTELTIYVQINHLKGEISWLCGVSFRPSKFLDFKSAKTMYNSCIYPVLSYCIGVWCGASQCTSRCNDLRRIHRKIVKNLHFFIFFINSCCIFRWMINSNFNHIYKFTTASYMYDILKHNTYPTLRSSHYMSYPSHN